MNSLQKDAAQGSKRILGRQIGRELSKSEIEFVAGGDGPPGDSDVVPTDNHPGTCTNEKDCDA